MDSIAGTRKRGVMSDEESDGAKLERMEAALNDLLEL